MTVIFSKLDLSKNLETKMWYRIFKVIYIFCIIGAFGFISLMVYTFKPDKEVDYGKSRIQCNGVEKFYYLSHDDLRVKSNDLDPLSFGHIYAKFGCNKYQRMKQSLPPLTEEEAAQLNPEDIPQNYTLILKYQYPGWQTWLTYTLSAYIGLFILALTIKKTFLYTVIGKNNPEK